MGRRAPVVMIHADAEPFRDPGMLLEVVLAAAATHLFDRVETQLQARETPGAADLFESYLDALEAEPLFDAIGPEEGVAVLGGDRWDEIVERLVLVPFGQLLDGLVDPRAWARVDRTVYIRAVVGGLDELRLAVNGSPDAARARHETDRLLHELARPLGPGA